MRLTQDRENCKVLLLSDQQRGKKEFESCEQEEVGPRKQKADWGEPGEVGSGVLQRQKSLRSDDNIICNLDPKFHSGLKLIHHLKMGTHYMKFVVKHLSLCMCTMRQQQCHYPTLFCGMTHLCGLMLAHIQHMTALNFLEAQTCVKCIYLLCDWIQSLENYRSTCRFTFSRKYILRY